MQRITFMLLITGSSIIQAQNIELKTQYQQSFPKFFLSNPNDPNSFSGIGMDIIHLINHHSETIKISNDANFTPFKRIMRNLAVGRIDVFVGMAKNTQRSKIYTYSNRPIYQVEHRIAVRAKDTIENITKQQLLSDYAKQTILSVSGTATARYLKQLGLNVDDGGQNIKSNLEKLLSGRARFFYFNDLALISSIKRLKLSKKIRLLPNSFYQYSHYIAYKKNIPRAYRQSIDKTLARLERQGKLKELRKSYFKE